jgi:hypothetical protein
MLAVGLLQYSFVGGRWRRDYVGEADSLVAGEEDMMVVRHFYEDLVTSLIHFPYQHHKDLLDQHPRCLPVFQPDLGIKIDTRTGTGMLLRLRVWITVVLPRTVVRGRRRGNQKTVGTAGGSLIVTPTYDYYLTCGSGSVAFRQAWMTVADLKGAELFYYVYDFLLYSTLVTSPPCNIIWDSVRIARRHGHRRCMLSCFLLNTNYFRSSDLCVGVFPLPYLRRLVSGVISSRVQTLYIFRLCTCTPNEENGCIIPWIPAVINIFEGTCGFARCPRCGAHRGLESLVHLQVSQGTLDFLAQPIIHDISI